MSPLIKVCGMTEAENIRNVELQGVDMIGFIFYPKSPRCLCQMPGYLPACAKRVGVFVNESKENILMYTDLSAWTTSSCMAMKLPNTAVPCAMQACTSSSFLYLAAQGPACRICLQWSVRLLPLRHQDPAVRRFRQPVRLEPPAPLQRSHPVPA